MTTTIRAAEQQRRQEIARLTEQTTATIKDLAGQLIEQMQICSEQHRTIQEQQVTIEHKAAKIEQMKFRVFDAEENLSDAQHRIQQLEFMLTDNQK